MRAVDQLGTLRTDLEGKEAVGLYLFLRRHEEELDTATLSVLNRLEQELFRRLSIEDMEHLEQRYAEDKSSG
jgi:hypothetical protein